jgi:hypothetical protein
MTDDPQPEREVIQPEVLPPGPVPRRRAAGVPTPRPPEWGPLLAAAVGLDLLGLAARGPLKIACAIGGAALGVFLASRLRFPLRQSGWAAALAGVYASLPRAFFLPAATLFSLFRLWRLRGG